MVFRKEAGHGKTGTREHGNTGAREHGSTETPKHGNMGTREHGNTGAGQREHGNTGTQEHRSTGQREHGNTGKRENRNTQTFFCTGIIRYRKKCHVRDPVRLNYLLHGGLETCVCGGGGGHSACFEVLNLCAGVSGTREHGETGTRKLLSAPE